jgi:glycosyltransferase involved in cell wall biosynthesis
MPDFVFYGTAAWDAPWLTEQNLAAALAGRGGRVLYVEPPISVATPLRSRSMYDVRRLTRIRLRERDGVALLQPVFVPPVTSSAARRLSAPVMRARVGSAARRLGLAEPVVIAAREICDVLDARARVYLAKDWIQAGAGLLGRSQSELANEVRSMAAWADIVCSISTQLQAGLRGAGIDSVVLRHGFHAELAQLYEAAEEPGDLSSLPRPLLGFAGRIDARLDIETIVELAERFPQGTVALVGPISPRLPDDQRGLLEERENIVLLGARSRDVLPAYLAHFDCSLIPYRRSEWSDYGSPLKLWDCLYAGPPIVGSGYVALKEYAPTLLRYADGPDEFIAAVADALRTGQAGIEERRAFALSNSWDARAEQLESLVASVVDGRHAPSDAASPSAHLEVSRRPGRALDASREANGRMGDVGRETSAPSH